MRLLLLLALLATTSPAFGRFIGVETEETPVARLVENLEKIVKDNPNSVEALVNLGRAHGMAYAQKHDPLFVTKAYHGQRPPPLEFGAVAPAGSAQERADAQTHLNAAVKYYERALEIDKKNLVVRLGHAWLTEQAGKKNDAITLYRAIIAEAWANEQSLEYLGPYSRTITAEAASYLIPLLDMRSDSLEISNLKSRMAILDRLQPGFITPIVAPLADGLNADDLEAPDARVMFDLDGSGLGREWSWITPRAAWLVYAPTGSVTSGRQLFGNITFWMFWSNGYAPLAALDDNRDGALTGQELSNLALWRDENSDGVTDRGEVKLLADCGVVAVSCKWHTLASHKNNIAFSPTGITFRDGRTRATYDVALKPWPLPALTYNSAPRAK